jgi:hypothetical protein
MKKIYQDATHVIVWLGPSGEASDVAFDVMNRIGKEVCDIGFWDVPRESRMAVWSNDSAALSFK